MQPLICVARFEHSVSFALVEDGVHRFAQYHNRYVREDDNRWSVEGGAEPFYAKARPARAQETVNVDGAELSDDILAILRSLPVAVAA